MSMAFTKTDRGERVHTIRGVRGLRWLETGYDYWQLELAGRRQFLGGVFPAGADEDAVWVWWCFAGQGECPTRKEAWAQVEAFMLPIRQYVRGTTFGDNRFALFELTPEGEAVVRAVGGVRHCDHWLRRLKREKPEYGPLVIIDVATLEQAIKA